MFTLGQHYVAGSLLVELTPLWNVTPVLLANVEDPSALVQLTSNYSLSDNMTLLGSINVPIGPGGSSSPLRSETEAAVDRCMTPLGDSGSCTNS